VKSLFGEEIPDVDPVKPGGRRAVARPAPIGSGPDGEKCGTCTHGRGTGRAGKFKKCWLNKSNWSCGPGTDIKWKHEACSYWEAME